MRPDVQALLERLDQGRFHYQYFADPIADVDSWAIFAAVLGDKRVVGQDSESAEEPHFVRSPNFIGSYQRNDEVAPQTYNGSDHHQPQSIGANRSQNGHADKRRQSGSLRLFLSGLSEAGGDPDPCR